MTDTTPNNHAAADVPPVAAGVLNFNHGPVTAQCVRMLMRQTVRPSPIIVVDNASRDDSLEFLRREFQDDASVRFIANDENLGFARGQNQAMRATDSEFFLAINPDAILREDYIERLVEALRDRPEAGYATGLLYYCKEDGSPLPYVFSAGHWWLRSRSALNRYHKWVWPEDLIESGEVGGASGCAPLYRREMLRSIDLGGGEYYDGTYFMYLDDVDLDWRAHLAGWTCWFEKSAVGWHESEVTASLTKPEVYAQLVTNRWLMILKNDTLGNFLRHVPYIVKSDFQCFFPEVWRLGGVRYLFGGLGRRTREAWRKRSAVRAATRVSPARIRAWMDLSLRGIRSHNAYRVRHPERVRPMSDDS
jgi:GT2 family glycosyltransferase